MTRDPHRSPHEPTPDQLAAYFDGELSGPAHAAVESWLTDKPDVGNLRAGFLDRDDDLTRAWQRTRPADPAPGAWSGVLGRIDNGVSSPVAVPFRRRRLSAFLMASVGAAAAVVALVFAGKALRPPPTKPAEHLPDIVSVRPHVKDLPEEPEESEEYKEKAPFVVASPADVRIICMNGNDTHVKIAGQSVKSLIVGEPPVNDAMILLTSYERTRLVDSADPEVRFFDWGAPMIVDPAVLENGWRP